MENLAPEIVELIVRHLQGLATQPEEEQLLQWRQSNTQNQASFEDISRAWNSILPSAGSFEPDVQEAWSKVKVKTIEKDKVIVSKGKQRLFPDYFWQVAASVLLLLGIGLAWFFVGREEVAWASVSSGEFKKRVALPDSSVVWLNTKSTIEFSDFSGELRLVKLSGEGFFQVTKNPSKPFQIMGKQSITEVLGTSFRLRSPENGPDVVEVATGLVAFSALSNKAEKVYLKPGKRAEIQTNGKPFESPITDPNFVALQTNRLVFDNTPISEVCQDIESYFGISVTLSDASLINCRFTGSFQNPDLHELLKVIELSANLRFEKTKSGYFLSGKGCQK